VENRPWNLAAAHWRAAASSSGVGATASASGVTSKAARNTGMRGDRRNFMEFGFAFICNGRNCGLGPLGSELKSTEHKEEGSPAREVLRAVDTMALTASEIERIAHVA
jgi:hypothetical protein